MYPQGCVIISRQADVGRDIFLILIKDIIVRVQFERPESQDRVVGEQMQVDPFFHFIRT